MSELLKALEEYEEGKEPKYIGVPIDVLIDGDIPAYRSAAATDGKCYTVSYPTPSSSWVKKEFKYHKEALKQRDIWDGMFKGVKMEVSHHPEPITHAIHNVDNSIKSILQEVSDHFKRPVKPYVYITGSENFRDAIHPDYKKSRKETRRPHHLSACKKHLIDKWDADYVEGYEADDLLCIESYSRKHKDCVIVSLDKDLLQIPGSHYNFVKKEFTRITEAEGRHLFWKQVLTGDKVDDIEGLHGIGPVKSNKLLEDLYKRGTEFDYYQRILEIYMAQLPVKEVPDITYELPGEPVRVEVMDLKMREETATEYYTRIVKRVSRTARLLYLCRNYEEPWQPPAGHPSAFHEWQKHGVTSDGCHEIYHELMEENTVKAIKLMRKYSGMGLKESKALISTARVLVHDPINSGLVLPF